MKIKCPFCNAEYVNDYHLAAAHTKAYHDLLFKIHEKIEQWIPNDHMIYPYGYDNVVKVLKSLLENEKK